MPDNINTLKSSTGGFTWVNILNARKPEIDYLKKKYKFDDLDLRDSYAGNTAQRPKFYIRNNYSFLILQFPVFNKKTRTIDAEEVNFFIGNGFIITCHKNNLPPLVELTNLCSVDKFYREQYLSDQNTALLYEIILRLQEYCYPILDHTSLDIKNIENNIFKEREREMVRETLLIKRNILNFRKIMEAHKDVLQKLARTKISYLDYSDMKNYYNDLIENTKNIWDVLNGQKEMIEALEQTNTALISFKLGDVMRFLTIFSVIIFPLNLLAAIFSMKPDKGMPFVNNAYGFWIVLSVIILVALSMLTYFKRKRWL